MTMEDEDAEALGTSRSPGYFELCCFKWRLWIRPVVMLVYFTVIVVVLPLLILDMLANGLDLKVEVRIIAGVFTMLAVPISLWDITQHLVHYNKPHMQKYIIRILWMVPIYALNAWLGLMFPSYAIFMDTCRECYEAYVIYNFMMFLLKYLQEEADHLQGRDLANIPTEISHIFPLCCLKPWKIGSSLIHRCKHGILQYTVVRPCTTVISLICEVTGVYGEGQFKANVAYPYMIAINNLSQFIAMYHLVLFYRAYRETLQPMRPIGKFLCIKAVVFFSFFQGVIIAILVFTGAIESWFLPTDVEHAPQGIQNFLICIEMFLAAVAHHFSFSYRPYIDLAQQQYGCCFAFLHMWDVSDVRRDFAEHIYVIRSSVSRQVRFGRFYRGTARHDEKSALLPPSADGALTSPVASVSGYQTMSDSDHEGINAGLSAIKAESFNNGPVVVHATVENRPADRFGSFVDLENTDVSDYPRNSVA